MRILYIEDNPGDARLIKEMLSDADSGTTELECETMLASGLEHLASERFDLLLLDLTLPDSQGLETLQKVQAFEQKVPVVVLTGMEDDETAQKSLESGAQDYLVKGKITADSLERSIRYAMGRRSAEEALRVSEEHYRLLVESAGEVILTTDLDLIVTYVSPSVERQSGFTAEEVTGRSSREFITAESFDVIEGALADQLARQGETDVTPPVPVIIEVGQCRKDGSTYPAEANAGFLRNPDGTPYGVIVVSRNITKRREAEEALRQTSAYLESLLDYANAPIIVWDPEFKIQRFNHAFERLTGYKADEVIKGELSLLFPEETREESLGKIERTLSGEYWESVEIPILRKDGDVRVALWNSANIYDEDGDTIIATIAQGQDITERKAAEEALRESEERFRQLADNLPEVIFEADSLGRFVYVNSNALEAFGYTEEELYSSSISVLDMISEEYREQAVQRIQMILSGGAQGSHEYMAKRKDGSTFPAIISTLPIVEGEMTVGLRGVLTDITAQKEGKEALQRVNEELDGYAHTVSHDLKSPLSAVALSAEILSRILEGEGGEDTCGFAGEALRIIRENTARAAKLIGDLLALAEADQAPVEDQPADISEVVGSVLEENKALLKDHGVRVNLEGDLLVAAMDPTHAYQLFANLVGNAIRHNDSKNLGIDIRGLGETEPGRLRYLVRDNGQGIAEKILETLFTPFVKGERGGTGLGLSIVDKVVRLYGGEIRAFNDDGACFEFSLPMHLS